MMTKRPSIQNSKIIIRSQLDPNNYSINNYQLTDLQCLNCDSKLTEIRSERWFFQRRIVIVQITDGIFHQNVMVYFDNNMAKSSFQIGQHINVCGYLAENEIPLKTIKSKKLFIGINPLVYVNACHLSLVEGSYLRLSLHDQFPLCHPNFGYTFKLIIASFLGSDSSLLIRISCGEDIQPYLPYFLKDIEHYKGTNTCAIKLIFQNPTKISQFTAMDTVRNGSTSILWIDFGVSCKNYDVDLLRSRCDLSFNLSIPTNEDANTELCFYHGKGNRTEVFPIAVNMDSVLMRKLKHEMNDKFEIFRSLVKGLATFLASEVTEKIVLDLFYVIKLAENEQEIDILSCCLCDQMEDTPYCDNDCHSNALSKLFQSEN